MSGMIDERSHRFQFVDTDESGSCDSLTVRITRPRPFLSAGVRHDGHSFFLEDSDVVAGNADERESPRGRKGGGRGDSDAKPSKRSGPESGDDGVDGVPRLAEDLHQHRPDNLGVRSGFGSCAFRDDSFTVDNGNTRAGRRVNDEEPHDHARPIASASS